jgi:hypothetical protein
LLTRTIGTNIKEECNFLFILRLVVVVGDGVFSLSHTHTQKRISQDSAIFIASRSINIGALQLSQRYVATPNNDP